MKPWRQLVLYWLEIGALCSFALAQPLFELLSRNTEFLVVRRSQPLDIILLVLAICVALPTALVLLEVPVALASRKASQWMHALFLAALVALMLLPVLKRWGGLPGWAWVSVASFLGLAFSLVHWRSAKIQSLLVWLWASVPLFLGLFIFNSPVYALIFPKRVTAVAPTPQAPQTSAPVVL